MGYFEATWALGLECTPSNDILDNLIDGEEITYCCKSIRDTAAFTNFRFIYCDSQGITGTKKEIYSIPYRSIDIFSSENAGTIDLTSEIEIWVKGGHIKIHLNRQADVRYIGKLLAFYTTQ